MSLTAFKGRCPHCGHDHGQNTFDVALGTLTPSEQARLDEQFANYAKQKLHLYGGEVMSDRLEELKQACDETESPISSIEYWASVEIVHLREQVAALTKELFDCKREFKDDREELRAAEQQLAALSEQVEKQKDALLYVMRATCLSADDNPDSPIGMLYKRASNAYELPDIASPVLNRIRAEGVRKASTLVSLVRNDWASAGDSLSVQAAEYLISALDARAAELEKTNG